MGIIELERSITHTLPRITDPFIETQRKNRIVENVPRFIPARCSSTK